MPALPASHSLPAETFSWQLQGRIVAIDNGATLASLEGFQKLMQLNSFAVITFDPASRLHGKKEELQGIEEFQLVPHATLGNGEPTTLFACLDPRVSGTLEPLLTPGLNAAEQQARTIIAQLPLPSVALDEIEGINSLDWLLLDDCNDNLSILRNGTQTLQQTLLIQVRVGFRPTYRHQSDLGSLCGWMSEHGFQLHCMRNTQHRSLFPDDLPLEIQGSEIATADLIFIPSRERLDKLPHARLHKLAFLLSTFYKIHDLTYQLLSHIDVSKGKQYLIKQGLMWEIDEHERYFTLTAEYSPDIWQNA